MVTGTLSVFCGEDITFTNPQFLVPIACALQFPVLASIGVLRGVLPFYSSLALGLISVVVLVALRRIRGIPRKAIITFDDTRTKNGDLILSYSLNGRTRGPMVVKAVNAYPNRPLARKSWGAYQTLRETTSSMRVTFSNSSKVLWLGFSAEDEFSIAKSILLP